MRRMETQIPLDAIDRRILRALQGDGRITYDVLAAQVSLSPSATLRRVKRLEESGVIARYVALVAPERVGLGLTAYLNVRLEKHAEVHKRNPMDLFRAAVQTWPEVVECAALTGEMDYLLRLWANIKVNERVHRAPVLLYRDLNLMLRVVRDNLTPELSKVIVDDRVAHEKLSKFVSAFMPDCGQKIEQYTGREPIFDGYGIELELNRALERKVPLKSGGSLVFDQGEALTAIDVNTGKFVGAKGKTLEETITQTNMEAAEEIADQLRLRNLGGIIIIDFIDMDKESNRRKVYRKLQDVLRKDRAKAHITKISEMGLVEMSRKRTRESLGRLLTAPCESCNGKGYTKSASTVCYEILREIRREAPHMTGDSVLVQAAPPVAELMNGPETAAIDNMVKRIQRGIEVQSRKDFHIEKFEIRSKNKGRGND